MKSNNIGDIVRRLRNEGIVASIKQKGRPKKLTTREERGILRKVNTKPRLCAPKEVAELFTEHEKTVSPQTIRRILRIEFSVNHLKKDESWCNDLIFLVESKINLFEMEG